jgi:hypothetical protein
MNKFKHLIKIYMLKFIVVPSALLLTCISSEEPLNINGLRQLSESIVKDSFSI